MSKRFLALLRGINVGGKNIISKEDLKSCFEELGFANIRTYIQSGNILFRSDDTSIKRLTSVIKQGLSEKFSYEADAVVLSEKKYRDAVAIAPVDWGQDQAFKHNALFVLSGSTASQLIKSLPEPKPDIERVTIAPGVIFWSISKEQQSKTSLMKLSGMPEYRRVTVRNHNTVFKLLQMFEEI